MFLSVFELFKIGVGPSSSHTVGPMVAAARFLDYLRELDDDRVARVSASLHGSLAFTGKGHWSDKAVILGLAGEAPDTVDPEKIPEILENVEALKAIRISAGKNVEFDPNKNIEFDFGPPLSGHANGLKFYAFDKRGELLFEETFYSIGGGFVVTKAELVEDSELEAAFEYEEEVPYPFTSAGEALELGVLSGMSIGEMKRANEEARDPTGNLDARLDTIWNAMNGCMERGLTTEGTLPGGLDVKRRAGEMYARLMREHGKNLSFQHTVMDWLSAYAMAVNEENAAGGRVVTAPTNGAAGVIPAVIRYYADHCQEGCREGIRTFLLVASAIGGIIKHNASISGAEVGCQGEVGSAAAMAAAGLCAALGGTNAQIENAAEIALEHHLGMTCDPVGGLVQVPCIERNALGAVKAVTAASLALRGDGSHFVPLDSCIETMRQTGRDMSEKYKETSTGGLAVSVVEC